MPAIRAILFSVPQLEYQVKAILNMTITYYARDVALAVEGAGFEVHTYTVTRWPTPDKKKLLLSNLVIVDSPTFYSCTDCEEFRIRVVWYECWKTDG